MGPATDPRTDAVIILTRLGGHEMAVNPDLIERAEPTPDTVITMVDGHKLVVAESLDELVARVRSWRASVAAEAYGVAQELAAEGDGLVATEVSEADLSTHSALGSSLARVLRMPKRED
jgi:flagellar protein FlbD